MNVQYRPCACGRRAEPFGREGKVEAHLARSENVSRAGRAALTRDSAKCLFPCHSFRGVMPEQFWLPGLEAPPVPTDGLFFAVFPDAHTATGISKLAQQLCVDPRPKSKPLAANRLHVTLVHLGNFAGGLPPASVNAAMSAAASVTMAPFTVEFDSALTFAQKPRPGPLVLGGEEGVVGLHALHDALGAALQSAGFGDHAVAAKAPYTPHVTLAYGAPWIAPRPVEAVSWNVREFALVHSLLGRTKHVVLARWPLAAG
jgi:RNA 2',3'-cyclic 3'-phosphodiesterase